MSNLSFLSELQELPEHARDISTVYYCFLHQSCFAIKLIVSVQVVVRLMMESVLLAAL